MGVFYNCFFLTWYVFYVALQLAALSLRDLFILLRYFRLPNLTRSFVQPYTLACSLQLSIIFFKLGGGTLSYMVHRMFIRFHPFLFFGVFMSFTKTQSLIYNWLPLQMPFHHILAQFLVIFYTLGGDFYPNRPARRYVSEIIYNGCLAYSAVVNVGFQPCLFIFGIHHGPNALSILFIIIYGNY